MTPMVEAGPRAPGTDREPEGLDLTHLSTILSDIDAVLWEARAQTWASTFVSGSVVRILGHPLEAWRADPLFFVHALHPDDRERLTELSARLVQAHGSAEVEYRLRAADGRYLWFRDLIRVVHDDEGGLRLRGVGVECTRQRWEREWNAANRRILEMIARGGTLDDVLQRVVTETEAQLPGKRSSMCLVRDDGSLRSVRTPSLPAAYHDVVDTLCPGEGVGSCGTAIWRRARVVVEDISTDPLWSAGRDGVLPLGLRACWSQPIFASDGAVLGTFAIYDTTPSRPTECEIVAIEMAAALAAIAIERHRADADLRQKEEQLRHAQKMDAIGRLAGGMAHDFNNILTTIFGHAEHVFRGADADSELARHSRGVLDAANRATAITRRLLTVSRKQFLELQTIELNEVVDDLLVMLRGLIGEDIELVSHLDERAGHVVADRDPIGQILINLAVNARDAMPRGGRLIVETARVHLDDEWAAQHVGAKAGEHVLLAVTDTGSGMDPETRARAFEPFFTTKATGRGTGLGLSMVYGIVRQLSGTVWIYSEPGQGTTFKIYLPVAEPIVAAGVAAVNVTAPRGTSGRTVLVVEDQEDVRTLICEALQAYGFNVLDAQDGASGLAAARDHAGEIDLVLTDVVMPRLGGPELVRQLRCERPDIPVMFMSGYTETALRQLDPLDPGASFIEKPFSPSALASRVAAVLGDPTPAFAARGN